MTVFDGLLILGLLLGAGLVGIVLGIIACWTADRLSR